MFHICVSRSVTKIKDLSNHVSRTRDPRLRKHHKHLVLWLWNGADAWFRNPTKSPKRRRRHHPSSVPRNCQSEKRSGTRPTEDPTSGSLTGEENTRSSASVDQKECHHLQRSLPRSRFVGSRLDAHGMSRSLFPKHPQTIFCIKSTQILCPNWGPTCR